MCQNPMKSSQNTPAVSLGVKVQTNIMFNQIQYVFFVFASQCFWYMLNVELKLVNDLGVCIIPPDKADQVVVVEVLVYSSRCYLCCSC
jgi:hypothetical protein